MSLVRRPVAAVLSLASTVLVGGVAWGLVAHADDTGTGTGTTPAVGTPSPTSSDVTVPVNGSAPQVTAAVTATATKPAPKVTPKPVPPKPAPAKGAVPTTVTIQAVNTTVGEGQMYRAIFKGSIVATSTKKGLPAQRVVLMRRPLGATAWTRVLTAVSSAPDGKLLIALEQQEPKASYRFVFDGQAPYKSSASGIVTVTRS